MTTYPLASAVAHSQVFCNKGQHFPLPSILKNDYKILLDYIILVQYSDKFMYSIVLRSIVLHRSQLYCIVNLLSCGCNIIQCYA